MSGQYMARNMHRFLCQYGAYEVHMRIHDPAIVSTEFFIAVIIDARAPK